MKSPFFTLMQPFTLLQQLADGFLRVIAQCISQRLRRDIGKTHTVYRFHRWRYLVSGAREARFVSQRPVSLYPRNWWEQSGEAGRRRRLVIWSRPSGTPQGTGHTQGHVHLGSKKVEASSAVVYLGSGLVPG